MNDLACGNVSILLVKWIVEFTLVQSQRG
jgi:hypothetical protein